MLNRAVINSFNRTILELKQISVQSHCSNQTAFNRTILELKTALHRRLPRTFFFPSNRTRLELKPTTSARELTVPSFFLVDSVSFFLVDSVIVFGYTIENVVGREYDPPRMGRSLPQPNRIGNYVG